VVSWDRFWGISTRCTFIHNLSNISRIPIDGIVFNNLGTAIRKKNTVFASGGITITALNLAIIELSIIINNPPLEIIFYRSIMIRWFFVYGLVIRWGWFVDGSWFILYDWFVRSLKIRWCR
jgi:hypothetical protein